MCSIPEPVQARRCTLMPASAVLGSDHASQSLLALRLLRVRLRDAKDARRLFEPCLRCEVQLEP